MDPFSSYLRWLDKYDRRAGENHPLGLILCAGKDHEEVELLSLGQKGIRVAEYLTQLPERQTLEKKLHQVVELAKEKIAHNA